MNKRLQEIETRLNQIKVELEQDGADVDALEQEVKNLIEERKQILERAEKRSKIINDITSGAGTVINDFLPKPEERKKEFTADTILDTPEYRSAYLKRLQGKELNDVEKRALTTASNSAGDAVPTQTLNKIIDKMCQTSALFPRINVSYVPGNLSIVVAKAKKVADWKTEGTDGTPYDNTVESIQLTGYELIKLVEMSAAAEAMTIDAFEQYITSEIGRQMAIAVENAILNGPGEYSAEGPTGILESIDWDCNNCITWAPNDTIRYDDLVDGLALLPTPYHNNAIFVMSRKMLFSGIRKIKAQDGHPIFTYNPQDRAAMTILGYPVILDDYMPEDTILLGDFSYYYMNFAKAPTIDVSREAGFKSGKVTYRGLAVVDGKPALAEAFVKISKDF